MQGNYRAFEPVLRAHYAELSTDPLLSGYLDDLLGGMRAQVWKTNTNAPPPLLSNLSLCHPCRC